MKLVEPKVFLIGETRIIGDELQLYLDHLGISEWTSDAPSDAEKLIEVMGRLCYRSFKPGLNPNVTKIREHNDEYLSNIIKVKHGSVIEHPMVNFILSDVSRVFTHELVRHRVGVAMSQESLRFVRLTELSFWIPSCFTNYPDSERREKILKLILETVEYLEKKQLELAELLLLDNPESLASIHGINSNDKDLSRKLFELKKKYTSGMRRIAPDGLATTIGWSVNPRTLRNVIEMRTNPGAEEEIRLVFGMIAEKIKTRYPNIFSDYTIEIVDGLPWFKTEHAKV